MVHWSLVDLGTVERNARFDVMHDMREVGNSIHIQSWIYASFGDYHFLVHMSILVDWTDVNGLNRIHRYLWCIWCIWCILVYYWDRLSHSGGSVEVQASAAYLRLRDVFYLVRLSTLVCEAGEPIT